MSEQSTSRPDGWIYAEDAALKYKLQGLKVEDANAPADGRPVTVRYRLPENELADLDFPIIIIEHSGISRAPEREHRGFVQLPYAPAGFEAWWDADDKVYDPHGGRLWSYFPIPYNLDYQVTILARRANHLIPLVGELARINRLPARFGYLEIPQDGTVRTLDLMGGPEFGYIKDANGKNIHQATYSVRVLTEFVQDEIYEFPDVQQLIFHLSPYWDGKDIVLGEGESFGIVGSRSSINWNTNQTTP